ncbi:MAG: hypothetical protein ACMXYF_05415 [Candidatus Woesearchaeota archaeon]
MNLAQRAFSILSYRPVSFESLPVAFSLNHGGKTYCATTRKHPESLTGGIIMGEGYHHWSFSPINQENPAPIFKHRRKDKFILDASCSLAPYKKSLSRVCFATLVGRQIPIFVGFEKANGVLEYEHLESQKYHMLVNGEKVFTCYPEEYRKPHMDGTFDPGLEQLLTLRFRHISQEVLHEKNNHRRR